MVKEGFGHSSSEKDVDTKVQKAAQLLTKLGATVEEVSIPMHLLGGALWLPIGIEGLTQTMMWGDGYGLSRPDLYVTSLMDFHRGWRHRANELSDTTKLFTLLGTYINKHHGSRYYGKAMNITRKLIAAYDEALSLRETKTVRKRIGAFRLWRAKSVSRCAVKAPARDSVRMRQRPVCR